MAGVSKQKQRVVVISSCVVGPPTPSVAGRRAAPVARQALLLFGGWLVTLGGDRSEGVSLRRRRGRGAGRWGWGRGDNARGRVSCGRGATSPGRALRGGGRSVSCQRGAWSLEPGARSWEARLAPCTLPPSGFPAPGAELAAINSRLQLLLGRTRFHWRTQESHPEKCLLLLLSPPTQPLQEVTSCLGFWGSGEGILQGAEGEDG